MKKTLILFSFFGALSAHASLDCSRDITRGYQGDVKAFGLESDHTLKEISVTTSNDGTSAIASINFGDYVNPTSVGGGNPYYMDGKKKDTTNKIDDVEYDVYLSHHTNFYGQKQLTVSISRDQQSTVAIPVGNGGRDGTAYYIFNCLQ